MSVVVLSIPHATRGLIAVDTCCTGSDGFSEVGKLHLMPHAGVAMAGVGSVVIAQAAFRWASRPGVNVDFDLIAQGLRKALDGILAQELDACAADPQAAAAVGGGNQIFLLGYSPAAGRMQGRVFVQELGAKTFSEYDTGAWFAQPSGAPGVTRQPVTVGEVAARAREVVRYGQAIDPACGFGGRIVAAEITSTSISTHVKEIQ